MIKFNPMVTEGGQTAMSYSLQATPSGGYLALDSDKLMRNIKLNKHVIKKILH